MPRIMGDYQTARRMAAKLSAIPLPDFAGKSVIDFGCDFGAWCEIASHGGASRVVGVDRGRLVRKMGHVDLASRNNAQAWPNCTFVDADIARDWPQLGAFDVVLCFSLYHHLYGECGDHDMIWRYLRQHTDDGGVLLWEGPMDTRDGIAAQRARAHGNYTRDAILTAASRYYDVEVVGPALHRPHRHVLRCTPKGEHAHHGESAIRSGPGIESVHAGTESGLSADHGVAAVSGDAQHAGGRFARGARPAGRAARKERAGQPHRSASVVARDADIPEATDVVAGGSGSAPAEPRAIPGVGIIGATAGARADGGPARTDIALVIGGGDCVWDDIVALEELIGEPWSGLVVAANDVGCHWPRRLDAWATLHPGNMAGWVRDRALLRHTPALATYSSRAGKGIDHHGGLWGSGGASGLLAVAVAIDRLHCTRVVLCGVPMTKTPHFEESRKHQKGRPWGSASGHLKAWKNPANLGRMANVRSMSGATEQLLGAPTREWILGLESEAAA